MRRLVVALMLVLLLVVSLTVNAANFSPQDLQVSFIVPPVIRRAVTFPIVAVVTNSHSSAKFRVKTAAWRHSGIDRNGIPILQESTSLENIGHDLEPSGPARQIVNGLREKQSRMTLSTNEVVALKDQTDKLRRGSYPLRFIVTQKQLEQIKNQGQMKISLNLTAQNLETAQEESLASEVTLAFDNRIMERPPVAPGAHHSDWYFGDTHSHSTYTWDYYFGDGIYTISELKSLAMAAGLDWLVLTDHAYCLDSSQFNTQKSTVTSLCDSTFAFLYGEELSCAELVNGSKAYDTCHYNGILNSSFVSCSTDIFRKASSPDSQQGINYLKQNGGLVTINHANWGTGSLESWNFNINTYPYTHGETGMELLNGAWSDTNNGSTTRWVDRRLLKGEKVFPFAGSDTESSNHFGECYTVVYADYLTQSNIKDNLGRGHQYATTYPGLALWARPSGTSTWSWMGDTLTMGTGTAELYISYTDSVDGMYIYVMKGKNGWSAEQQIYSTTTAAGSSSISINASVEPGCYLRVYCREVNDQNYRAYTAPIWFN